MRVPIALALVAVIALLLVKLASAPLNARYSADECLRAYADARSHSDSARVDLHPFKGHQARVDHRCGEVRAVRPANAADIPALGQPDEQL